MEKIKRPVQLNKNDMQVLSEKNYKKNTDTQLNTIYDKLDEIVDVIANDFQGDPGPVGPPGPPRSDWRKRGCVYL